MYPLLLLLALVLPFELTRPLFTLGPLGITNLEVPLYALLAVSLCHRDVWRPAGWTWLHGAAALWAAVHLLSAAAAPGDRSSSLRFALRMSAGAALLFPVSKTTLRADRAARVHQALLAGAIGSAAFGLAEAFWPTAASWLTPFKTVTARVAEVVRAGGPFQYPNPAALYWAAAVPLALGLRPSLPAKAGRGSRSVAIATALFLVAAIVATGSRGGVLAAAAALLLLAIVHVEARRASFLALAGLALAVILVTLTKPALTARDLGPGGEIPWFVARFEAVDPPSQVDVGREIGLRVRMSNVGELPWETRGPAAIELGARWLDGRGRLDHEEPSAPLEKALPPGATELAAIALTAPLAPGLYTVRWQLVQGGAVFESSADASGDLPIEVVGQPKPGLRSGARPRPVQRQVTRLELWRAGGLMWRERPLLGVGPDNFRRRYGPYLGDRPLDDRINANSLYVETLADLGLAGVVALALLLFTATRVAVRTWRHGDLPEREIAIASAAALLAFAIHGLVDNVLGFTPLYGLLWIHAGLLAGRTNLPRPLAAGG